MSRRPPDVCKHVFVCAFGDWQIQAAPGARSDLGGAVAMFTAVVEAHRVHVLEDHTEAQSEAMRRVLKRMEAPQSITERTEPGHKAAYLGGVPLPRWWVDR